MLTVEGLIAEVGLERPAGSRSGAARVRWVPSAELPDPTPWLTGGELLLTTEAQLAGPTGRDLSSTRDRIEFWLGLRGPELAR